MKNNRCIRILLLALAACATAGDAYTQVRIRGRVFDITRYNPLEAVSVMSTAGSGTTTDSLGNFSLIVGNSDSIWFSYLNKPTPKYPVKTIATPHDFQISLHVESSPLKEVRITPPNYRLDSIQNRLDYAKVFNFRKPGIGSSLNLSPGGGVGLDINELIHMFQFRRNRRMLAFQERLLREEEERFIDHRFNRALIIKLTQLKGPALDTFIERYRPPVEFVEMCTDYELQDYIKKSFSHYQHYTNMLNELRRREDD